MLFQRKHFLNSQKITLRFRRLRRVTFAPKRSLEGHQQKEKHLRNLRKCLIFSVAQTGLEPMTSIFLIYSVWIFRTDDALAGSCFLHRVLLWACCSKRSHTFTIAQVSSSQ